MYHRGPVTTHCHRARAREERSLSGSTFVGSFPTPDFEISPRLPEVALFGRSNVGKSSLVNAILSRRAIARTSATPGKTQACNVFEVEGRYYLIDLPGYGYARLSKAKHATLHRLLEQYLERRRRLIGSVWLLDVRRNPTPDDMMLADRLAERGLPVLVAITKADKIPRTKRAALVGGILSAVGVPPDQHVLTSARTQEGIDDLRHAIDALVRGGKAA